MNNRNEFNSAAIDRVQPIAPTIVDSILERAIAFFSPGVAVRRAADRLRLFKIRDGYEGAARGRRTDNWKTSTRDSNAEILPVMTMLRNRSRDLRRNNPYAESAVSSIIDNTVGYGIKPKPKGRNKSITKKAKDAWAMHCETTAIDREGKHDIYGLQSLAMGTIVESGAVVIRRYLMSSEEMKAIGATLPFQIQVLEPDFIDHTKHGPQPDGSYDLRGIRFEKTGRVRGYWLYAQHPGAALLTVFRTTSFFVPARDILHVYRMDRPGQIHGVPWAAPVMLRMRNFDEVEDAYIEREKVSACFAVFFTGLDTENSQKKIQLAERLEPGMIDFAPPGTQVSFASPPGVNGYRDFASINLHAIAAGFGVPYEELAGDMEQVNFSSGRMGWQKYQRRIERWQWQMFVPGFCSGVWSWFNSSLQFTGATSEDCDVSWVPPRRMMVNPKEEIAALKDEIRNGLTTWQQAVSERGFDAEEQAQEIKQANDLLDANGLKLDCDPRFALPAGSAGATDPGANDGGDGSGSKKAASSGK